jgi:hypothetical protein
MGAVRAITRQPCARALVRAGRTGPRRGGAGGGRTGSLMRMAGAWRSKGVMMMGGIAGGAEGGPLTPPLAWRRGAGAGAGLDLMRWMALAACMGFLFQQSRLSV